MTDRRFALAEHLLETKPWELFAMVEMGPDRMHHGFWKYMDPEHRKHEPGNPYENAILDYHRHVDGLIGRLLEHADEDTVVLVVSDHGAKRLDGGIRVNEWLRREGLLATLARARTASCSLARRRRRLVANDGVGRGRLLRAHLPQRRRARAGGDRSRPRTTRRVATTSRAGSRRSPTSTAIRSRPRVYKPGGAVRRSNGRRARPDRRTSATCSGARSARSAATRAIQTFENDTGPDDANHAQDGLFVVAGPGIDAAGATDAHLLDIAPTVLAAPGLEAPAHHARHEPPGRAGSC